MVKSICNFWQNVTLKKWLEWPGIRRLTEHEHFWEGFVLNILFWKEIRIGGTNGSSIRRDWKSKPWGVLVGVVCIVHYILYSCCVFVYHRMVYCVLLCLRIIPVVDCVNTTPGSSVGWPDLGKWSSGRGFKSPWLSCTDNILQHHIDFKYPWLSCTDNI